MQFFTDLTNHIEELQAAVKRSYAALLPRVLATMKADPMVAGTLLLAGAVAGVILHKVL